MWKRMILLREIDGHGDVSAGGPLEIYPCGGCREYPRAVRPTRVSDGAVELIPETQSPGILPLPRAG